MTEGVTTDNAASWPPTTASPYDSPKMAAWKPGNFFTLCDEGHPAYELYRALTKQGWAWEWVGSSRHSLTLTNGDRYVTASLFGQGQFGCRNDYGEYGIGLEDFDNIWSDALPHLAAFMRTMSDERAAMMKKVEDLGHD